MSDSITTQLDTTGPISDAARQAAADYLTRSGNADLLEILGLADAAHRPTQDEPRPSQCHICGHKMPTRGHCRRTGDCSREARRLLAQQARRRT